MRISMREEIEQIWVIFGDGNIDEAYAQIQNFEKYHDLTYEDQHWSNLLKASILLNMSKFQESLQIAEQMYRENKDKRKLYIIDAICIKWFNYYSLGRGLELREDVFSCEKLVNSEIKESQVELTFRRAFINLITGAYFRADGNLDKAIRRFKKGLEEIEQYTITFGLLPFFSNILGMTYADKGELDLALEYLNMSLGLFKGNYLFINYNKVWTHSCIGNIHFQKGDINGAINKYKLSLKIISQYPATTTFYWVGQNYNLIIKAYLFEKSPEKAKNALDHLGNYLEENKISKNVYFYKFGQALILASSTRTRNRAEAEKILKSIIEKQEIRATRGLDYLRAEIRQALILICDLYLKELRLTNDLEIIDDIQPYIMKLLEESEYTKSFPLQAQTYLLQGKISLLQMNMGDARRYLTQAQYIAQEHGLQLLAREISAEHDKFLEQLEEWENLKRKKASFSERMNLASLDFTMDGMQNMRALNPPELVDEEPLLLMVMSRDGVSYFNFSFREDWDADWLFSSFMSAFDTFSSELFSESIDRIKIGEHLILINPVEPFLVCYVIKGQSYTGLQKLNRFSDAIKWNTEIWDSLNRAVQTGEVLELDRIPSLGIILNDIFNLKFQETHV